MKKAILSVSFGTSHIKAIENSIKAIEMDYAKFFSDYDVFRAFTSNMVINILKKNHVEIDTVDDALKKLYNNKYEIVIIQPTHLICGDEYEKLCRCAEKYREKFTKLVIGTPLLENDTDIKNIIQFFKNTLCADNDFLVLMGHGSEHISNKIYCDMNNMCIQNNINNIVVVTVEAKPSLDYVIDVLKNKKIQSVILTPLMFVAGDHASNDMAGEAEDSWKSKLERNGIETEIILKGMGEYQEIRNFYIEHLKKAINSI